MTRIRRGNDQDTVTKIDGIDFVMAKKLKGIKGWLFVLFTIIVIILASKMYTLIYSFLSFFGFIEGIGIKNAFDPYNMNTITFFFINILLVFGIFMLGLSLYLGFNHKKEFRKWITISISYNAAILAFGVFSAKLLDAPKNILNEGVMDLSRTIFWGAIALIYIYNSKRAKNTFVK